MIAVITPIYATEQNGRAQLLKQTMRSVARQQYPHIHLIVDHGSPIDVASAIKDSSSKNVRYARIERVDGCKTSAAAMNFGIGVCLSSESEFFSTKEKDALTALCYVHSDDLFAEGSIERRAKFLEQGNVGMVYTDLARFSGEDVLGMRKGSHDSVMDILSKKLYGDFPHHTSLWDVDFLRYLRGFVERSGQVGVFDTALSGTEDRDVTLFSLRAALNAGVDIKYAPIVSVFYREHPKSITGTIEIADQKKNHKRISSKHFPNDFWYINDLRHRLASDLPWSLLTGLPEGAKKILRPIRDGLKGKKEESGWEIRKSELKVELEKILEE